MIAALLIGSTAVSNLALSRAGTLRQARFVVAGLGVVTLIFLLWWQLYRFDYPLWDGGWVRAWGYNMLFWVGEVPPSYLLLPAVIYLWLRGSLDASQGLGQRKIMRAFSSGCIGLVLLMLASLLDQQALPPETGGLVFLFFAMAMVALALAGLKAARWSLISSNDGPAATRLNRYWASSVLAIIAALLLLGLLLNGLFAPEVMFSVLDWTWGVVSQILILLIKVVSLLLYPILLFLAVVVPRLYYAISSTLARIFGRNLLPDLEELEALQPEGTADGAVSIIENLPDAWRWLALAVVFGFIGLVFALALRRLTADADAEGIEETREFIISSDLLLAQLARWRARGLGGARVAGFNPFLSLDGEPETRRIIRERYQKLLAATREQGRPRSPQQTPLEYARELGQLWPGNRNSIDLLTTRYVQARYSDEPSMPEHAEQARAAWQQLQKRTDKG
ncbi:MAG: DUF4129 domain-containing protein, partial [Anaerolineae bacterium]|nr:DUF4129 domain-containing protein [Anaerolineae bacterium]